MVTSVLKVLFFTALIISCFIVKVDREAFAKTTTMFEGGILDWFSQSIQLGDGCVQRMVV